MSVRLCLLLFILLAGITSKASQNRQGTALQRGITLAQQNRLEEAEREFDAISTTDPSYWQAQYLSAVTKAQLRKSKAAREILSRVLLRNPKHTEANYLMGMLLEEVRDYQSAESHFRRLTILTPKEARGWIALGRSLQEQGKTRGTEQAWKKAELLSPEDPALKFYLGNHYHRLGRFADATRYLLPVWQASPGDGETASLLAAGYAALEDFANLDGLLAGLSSDLGPQVQQAAGLAFLAAGDERRGFMHLTQAAQARPQVWKIQKTLADALLQAQLYEDAQKVYAHCLTLRPDDGEATFLLGRALYEDRRIAEALGQYRKAVELMPASATAWFHLGIAHRALEQTSEAKSALRKSLALKGDNVEALYHLGVIGLRRESTEAERYFRRAIQLKPDHIGAHYELGRLWISRSNIAEGLKEMDLVLKLDPHNTQAYYQRGTALIRLGKTSEAEKAFAQFEELEKQLREKRKILEKKILAPTVERP